MRGRFFHGRCGAAVLATLCLFWAQSAYAGHWLMTGRLGQGDQARVAGIDRDSVKPAVKGVIQVSMVSIERMHPGARKVLGHVEVECPALRFRLPSLTIWREHGARARVLSGPDDDWRDPQNPDDKALMAAICAHDYSSLTDPGDTSPDAYAAGLLGTPPDFGP
ncbi:hypothetical protein [Novosphingobium terrae]|uniref:hypothetical protein n=1 Tax=Novosphingobium terrae TaxID=2726189 RepID=UPI0019801366|nr:hypothetical protein [Novosphingobium terrae]